MSGSPFAFWHPTFFWHGLRYQAHIWCGENKEENVVLGVYNLGFGIQMVLRGVMQVTKIKKMLFFFTSGKFLRMIWLYCLRNCLEPGNGKTLPCDVAQLNFTIILFILGQFMSFYTSCIEFCLIWHAILLGLQKLNFRTWSNLPRYFLSHMATNPHVLYMKKNVFICTLNSPNMSLISQAMPEKSGV